MSNKKKLIILISVIVIIILIVTIISLRPIKESPKTNDNVINNPAASIQNIPSSQPPTSDTPQDQIVCSRNGFCN